MLGIDLLTGCMLHQPTASLSNLVIRQHCDPNAWDCGDAHPLTVRCKRVRPFLSGQLIRSCVAQLVKVPAWDMSCSGSRKEAFPDVCAQYEAEKSERSKLPASARPLLPDSRFCEPLQTIRRRPQINTRIHASINRQHASTKAQPSGHD
jgi:hypothetical protein